jgi:holo-[acyl-carrier protein] synthase
MILGIGTDLVEVDRLRQAHERHGDRFFERILLPDELAYCMTQHDPVLSIAARFSAKEALSKAFGTGIGEAVGWLDMEICRSETGQPWVRMHGKGDLLREQRNVKQIHLSVSHTQEHAIAMVVLEG